MNIQLCEFLLVDAHHVLGLGGQQAFLYVPPGHRVKILLMSNSQTKSSKNKKPTVTERTEGRSLVAEM